MTKSDTAVIRHLDATLARDLVASFTREKLVLDGITDLSVEVAVILADQECVLSLDGLAAISNALGKHGCRSS